MTAAEHWLRASIAMAVAAMALSACLTSRAAGAGPPEPPGVAPAEVRPRGGVEAVASLEQVVDGLAASVPVRTPPASGLLSAPAAGSAAETQAIRRYVRGRQRALDGQALRAAEDIEAALRTDPGSAALQRALAEVRAEAGDAERAAVAWERALALEPDDLRSQVEVGMRRAQGGDPAAAARLLGGAWPRLVDGTADVLDPAQRLAVGGTLARSLFRLGFDRAGLDVAMQALAAIPPGAAPATDPTVRLAAGVAREAGVAAFRCGEPRAALEALSLSTAFVPSLRTVTLLAYAQLVAGDEAAARQILGAMLAEAPWTRPELTIGMEWLLRALSGDRPMAEALALAAYAAGPGRFGEPAAPAERRARLGQLMVAAGDVDGGIQVLDAAVDDGALSPMALQACLSAAGDSAAARLLRARAIVERHPEAFRDVVRALVSTSMAPEALRAEVDPPAEDPIGEALSAGVVAAMGEPGLGWSRAEDALARVSAAVEVRATLEAMVLVGVAARDPALVVRAGEQAPADVEADAWWHASLARAYFETGASIEAEQSMARAELAASPRAGSRGAQVLSRMRRALDGRPSDESPLARAEAAMTAGDPGEAVAELLMQRAVDTDEAAAVDLLLLLMPRALPTPAVTEWATAEVARAPADPLAWRAAIGAAMQSGSAARLLADVDARLAQDPGQAYLLPVREELLRALGRGPEALGIARERASALPPGPRRAMEEAAVALQAADAADAVLALQRFAESAWPPPSSMRRMALDLARRIATGTPGRGEVIRRIARDAILADPDESLDFYAFEALGLADGPGAAARAAAVRIEASRALEHAELRLPVEPWLAGADFLLGQGAPAAAAEFLRARLDEPADLDPADLARLARAAIVCDGAAGGRAMRAAALARQLRGADAGAFGDGTSPGSEFVAVAELLRIGGDDTGAEKVLELGTAEAPEDGQLLNNLADLRLRRGAADIETVAMAEAARQALGSDPAVLDTLGWARLRVGLLKDADGVLGAVSLLRMAAAAGGDRLGAAVHERLGDALWRIGDADGAQRAWSEALRRAESGMSAEQQVALLRQVFAARTGLASIDAVRYHARHDGAVTARVRSRLEAVGRGDAPAVDGPPPSP